MRNTQEWGVRYKGNSEGGWLPVQGTARAVPQYRWQYRTKVVFALRLDVMFPT